MRLAKAIPSLFVGVVFLVAGIAKLHDPDPAIAFIRRMFATDHSSGLVVVTLAAVFEIVVGLWLLTFLRPQTSRLLAASALTSFLVALLLLGEPTKGLRFDADCGCFGGTEAVQSLEDYKAYIVVLGLVGLVWSLEPRLSRQHPLIHQEH